MQTQRGPTGWSETFWNNNSSEPAAVSEALSLGVLLRNVHSRNALMQGISVRYVDNDPAVRKTRRVSFKAINETLFSATSRLSGMYPTTCLRLNVFSADGRSNYVFLRGMPDACDIEGDYLPPPSFLIPINQLCAELASGSTGWARRQLIEANLIKPITAISTAGVVSCKTHNYTTNQRVRIGRTISTPNVDKVYRVGDTVTADTFNVVGFPPVAAAPTITEQSYAQLQLYEGVIISSAAPGGISKRNVGRPSGSPTGRQKTPKN